jgi:hypothetical protein
MIREKRTVCGTLLLVVVAKDRPVAPGVIRHRDEGSTIFSLSQVFDCWCVVDCGAIHESHCELAKHADSCQYHNSTEL